MSGYFKSKCASWERFLSPTCKWQSRHSYLLSAWLSHCVISGSVLLTFRRVIVHRVGACLAPRLSTSACVFSFMSDVRVHPRLFTSARVFSCLMYVHNLQQHPFGCIYLSKPVSLCTCLSETVRSQCPVFSVTTHFHTGLYNGFASYSPQAS